MSDETALVTGASGFIGQALVERLVRSGYRVRVLTRNRERQFPPGVCVKVGDLASGVGVSSGVLDGVQLLFHCAGELTRPRDMRPLHVDGTRKLLDCVSKRAGHGPLHWIQLSSVGAYGPSPDVNRDRRVTEESLENPVGEYEVTKTESDRLVARAASEGVISRTTLRPSAVIGARMPNASLRGVIAMVRRGRFFHIGAPGAVANYVHVAEVASALMRCAEHPGAKGQTFNLSDDCLWEELVEQVARTCGVSPPRVRVPEALVRTGAGAVGRLMKIPLTSSRIDALVNRTRYPSTRIESVLEFQFSRRMPAAIDDLIAEAT